MYNLFQIEMNPVQDEEYGFAKIRKVAFFLRLSSNS